MPPKETALLKKKLGEILVQSGLIPEEQLFKALNHQKTTGKRLGEVMVELKIATEIEIARTLGSQLGYQYVESISMIDREVLLMIPESLIRKHGVLPLRHEGSVLIVAMSDPLDFNTIQDLSFYCGYIIQPAIATPTLLSENIKRFCRGTSQPHEDQKIIKKIIQDSQREHNAPDVQIIPEISETVSESSSEQRHDLAPIIQMCSLIISNAIKSGASDIHIEPASIDSSVRFRVDGQLQEFMRFPKWVHGPVISRIKVLANLDIAAKRTPQDGEVRLKVEGREVTLRISTLPASLGEKIVIRILDQMTDALTLDKIGFSSQDLSKVKDLLSHKKGLILVTGPTGSGKTTSLYSMLNHLNQPTINIITVENPVEYHIKGITQVQINPESGLTFASALRAILRQDPNIILIGEIRDSETALIAMRAAMTGHLVLSTLHTNDSPSAVTRLMDLGVPLYMIASLLLGVIAQRLVRTICPDCKTPLSPTAEEMKTLNISEKTASKSQFFKGKGCKSCHQSGFRGRSAVYEVLELDPKLKEIISLHPTELQFKNACKDAGFITMHENGLQKIKEGNTTFSELMRCIGSNDELETFCGNCDHYYRNEFSICPMCGAKPKNKCFRCNQIIQTHWNYCPFCENKFPKNIEK
ncbi:MAG TPA: ATPase, T2SS/T4P/T4SS family [Nitrospiria bacterium]|nr:ATPase, T2SS/T4P/T4SS family [Nitrospiria bacterium]